MRLYIHTLHPALLIAAVFSSINYVSDYEHFEGRTFLWFYGFPILYLDKNAIFLSKF